MSNQYYYFISSLPMLRKGEKPPFSTEQFLGNCQSVLPSEAVQALKRLSLSPQPSDETQLPFCKAAKAWQDWLLYGRDCQAALRAAKLKRPAETLPSHTDFSDIFLKQQIENAFTLSPDERQEELDRLTWDFLSSLQSQFFFDINTIFIYLLQLQLLENIQSRQVDAGLLVFNQLVEDTMAQANTTRH